MDEYTSPLLAEPATTGNLSDIIVDNAVQAPHKVVFKRRAGERWLDVTCSEFLTQVQGVAKGLMAAGVQPGDRVGSDVQDPVRVDAVRLRDLVRRRRHGADLRDVLGRAGAVDPQRLRRGRLPRRDADHARRSSRRSAASLRDLEHVWVIDDGAVDELDRGRRGRRRRGARDPAYDGEAERPRHDHLHVRHDRPAQGLRAHPRQLPLRGGQRHQRQGLRRDAGRGLRTRAPRRCSSCRWPTSSPG